jgi:hypothetical protein
LPLHVDIQQPYVVQRYGYVRPVGAWIACGEVTVDRQRFVVGFLRVVRPAGSSASPKTFSASSGRPALR